MLCRLDVRDLLEADGYAVIEVGSAVQALERLDEAVGLVVADIRMPGLMDGLALTREVKRHRPDMAVVVVSALVAARPGDLPEGVRFVARPFLESRLHQAIDEASASQGRARMISTSPPHDVRRRGTAGPKDASDRRSDTPESVGPRKRSG